MDSVAIRSALRENRVLAAAVPVMVVVTAGCLIGMVVDPRTIAGDSVWLKPMKFSVSIGIYLATLLWMIPMITGERDRRVARRIGTVAAVTLGGIEMVAIAGQAARARSSHFAVGTTFDAAVWATMGAAITVLWLVSAVLGALLLRERSMGAPTAAAVRWGLGVALLGMATAFLMTGPTPGQLAAAGVGGDMSTVGAHAVGVPDGGPGLPVLGWSTEGGDLRAGHFVGLHALQGLPVLACALGGLSGSVASLRSERTRARLIGVAGAGWAGLTVILTWQALRGRSIVTLDTPTVVASVALAVALGATALAVLVDARRSGAAPPAQRV